MKRMSASVPIGESEVNEGAAPFPGTQAQHCRILLPMSSVQNKDLSRLVLEPIGIVRTSLVTRVEAARQPVAAQGARACIELFPGRNFEHALEDLSRWKSIWVIFWFHHNAGWRPKVLPPRSTSGRKGVFSTRSPHRPNPIGLSVVRLEKVEGLNIHVLDADMLDGTPVLDLKPYVAYTDSHPDAGNGWLDGAETSQGSSQPVDPVPAYAVTFMPLATEQAKWIEARTGLAIAERIRATLALGPEPHPYRRIRRIEGGMQLAVKSGVFDSASRDARHALSRLPQDSESRNLQVKVTIKYCAHIGSFEKCSGRETRFRLHASLTPTILPSRIRTRRMTMPSSSS